MISEIARQFDLVTLCHQFDFLFMKVKVFLRRMIYISNCSSKKKVIKVDSSKRKYKVYILLPISNSLYSY